jgi:hypothetical protein
MTHDVSFPGWRLEARVLPKPFLPLSFRKL